MTGRGSVNLYRPVSYRTAGGCCVCSYSGSVAKWNMGGAIIG
nr:MAG TPA_asm: Protein Family FAM60A [Caudoviricetes sp.]